MLYERFGFRLAKNLEQLREFTGLPLEIIDQLTQIITEIKSGEFPDNYNDYVQILLEHIYQSDQHRT